MKTTKVLVAVAMTGLLSTGLYAFCNGQGQGMMQKGMNNGGLFCSMKGNKNMMMQKGMQGNKNMMMQKGMQGNKNMMMKKGPMALLRQLNLTVDQKVEIAKIRKDMFSKKVTADVAFTKDGFDKSKFIEIMKQKRENMIESKAEMIDSVYKVLTPKQKEQFKVLMELKKDKKMAMMDKRMNFDQNCYGRR